MKRVAAWIGPVVVALSGCGGSPIEGDDGAGGTGAGGPTVTASGGGATSTTANGSGGAGPSGSGGAGTTATSGPGATGGGSATSSGSGGAPGVCADTCADGSKPAPPCQQCIADTDCQAEMFNCFAAEASPSDDPNCLTCQYYGLDTLQGTLCDSNRPAFDALLACSCDTCGGQGSGAGGGGTGGSSSSGGGGVCADSCEFGDKPTPPCQQCIADGDCQGAMVDCFLAGTAPTDDPNCLTCEYYALDSLQGTLCESNTGVFDALMACSCPTCG